MRNGLLTLLIVVLLVEIYLFIDLTIYHWQNIDVTIQRKFVNRWQENTTFFVLFLVLYVGFIVWHAGKKRK